MQFRKSKKMGPLRVTASKSGVSYSTGVKGARITKGADGKVRGTVGIPGTGVYDTRVLGTTTVQSDEPTWQDNLKSWTETQNVKNAEGKEARKAKLAEDFQAPWFRKAMKGLGIIVLLMPVIVILLVILGV